MMRNVTLGLLLASFMLLGIGRSEGSENTARPAAASSDESAAKTIVYIARNSPVNTLSAAIAVFLEGTDSRVGSDVSSNVLLIQTTEENQERVIALLQQLDRAPQTLRIQLHLLKARGEPLTDVDAASLTGQTDEVLKNIKTLESTGRVDVANRIELTAVENQKAMLQVGESVPVVAGSTFAGGRGVLNNYQHLDVGIVFSVEARVSGDSDIVMVVDFEKSEVEQRSADADEESRPAPQGVSRLTHQTTSRVHDGHSLLVGTLVSQSPDGVSDAHLVLSASIDTSGQPKQIATLQSSARKPPPKTSLEQANRGLDATRPDPRYLVYYAKLFDKYDQNDDEALDAEERSKMSKDCSDADSDGNGLVTVEEFTIWSMKR